MSTYAGDIVDADFTLYNPYTLEMADPDDGEEFVGVLLRDSNATTVEVTLIRKETGQFVARATIPRTWQRGNNVAIQVTATVEGQESTETIWSDTLGAGTTSPNLAGGPDTTPQKNPDHFGGANVNAKRPTIVVRQSHYVESRHQLRLDGQLFDLEPYGFSSSEAGGESEPAPNIQVTICEMHGSDGVKVYADLLDMDQSLIVFTVPDAVRNSTGIWLAEFAIITANNDKIFVGDAYIYVERRAGSCSGIPAIPEIRMFLRDYAQENELLDAVDFDASEMAFAADMCVAEWNETDPPDGPRYTTDTFPYRRNWLIGISSYLFGIAAEHYARNALPSTAGGISSDDKGKHQLYMQKAMLAKQEWKTFVNQRKIVDSVNAGGYREIGGVYHTW